VAEAASFVSMSPLTDKILLASNSNGAIHRIDVTSGTETALFTDPTMTNGIGGIKYDAPEMYFVTPVNGMFARFQLDPATGDAIAPVEIIATSGLVGVQDFALATWVDHTAFMVNYEQNSIQKIDEMAKVSTVVAGWRAPTCITTGNTPKDKRTLYVGTGGTLGLPGVIVSIKV
jgi:sugar lactone lactonase YvrE